MAKKKTEIKMELVPEDTVELMSTQIREISISMKKLREGKLNEKALLLLVANASGQAQWIVKAVMNGMESLEKQFLK